MAIIDLRNLVETEHDTVKFIGAKDGKEYSLPVKKTIKMSLQASEDVKPLFDKRDEMEAYEFNFELGFVYLTRWIKTYYPDKDLKWVKENITNEELASQLINLVTEMFFPKPKETVQPKRGRKRRLS
jgi:hypothetical protein